MLLMEPTTDFGLTLRKNQASPRERLHLNQIGKHLSASLATSCQNFPSECGDVVRLLLEPIHTDSITDSPLKAALNKDGDAVRQLLGSALQEVQKVFTGLLESIKPKS